MDFELLRHCKVFCFHLSRELKELTVALVLQSAHLLGPKSGQRGFFFLNGTVIVFKEYMHDKKSLAKMQHKTDVIMITKCKP